MHTVPHEWAKQAMILVVDFKSKPFRAALELFESMEVVESMPEHLIKLNSPGNIPTEKMAVKHREENPLCLQVPLRTALTSASTNVLIS